MKRLLKFLSFLLLGLLLIILALFIFDYDYLLKGIRVIYLKGHSTAYIDDYPEFDNQTIESGENHQPWPLHTKYNSVTATAELEEINEDLETVAFLIIKNDSIWFEKYAEGYSDNSLTNSFSMAKSITTALLGKAIQDGYIEGLEQPVSHYFPHMKSPFDSKLTVGDLASMSSGLNWNEDYYNPFSQTARAYFDEDLRQVILDLEVTKEPGKEFEYLSGNTLLLGMVIEKATGKSLAEYLSESFWKPMGMKDDALWQLDSRESGITKAYCCIASNARDFARFGKLFKEHGTWNGEQLLDSSFVAKATKPKFKDSPEYGYGFWLSEYEGKEVFYMRGVLGQYVIVIPEDDLIIVRLGKNLIRREDGEKHAPDFYIYIEEAYEMLDKAG